MTVSWSEGVFLVAVLEISACGAAFRLNAEHGTFTHYMCAQGLCKEAEGIK